MDNGKFTHRGGIKAVFYSSIVVCAAVELDVIASVRKQPHNSPFIQKPLKTYEARIMSELFFMRNSCKTIGRSRVTTL